MSTGKRFPQHQVQEQVRFAHPVTRVACLPSRTGSASGDTEQRKGGPPEPQLSSGEEATGRTGGPAR